MIYTDFVKEAKEHQPKYRKFLKWAKKTQVLNALPEIHKEAFEKIDCLSCGNCCRNYSPRFKMPDIKRISKHLRMKETAFIATYLKLDSEDDYVTKTAPCPFLDLEDNKCTIYDERPRDCARFPYTDEDVLLKQPELTLKNTMVCPAMHYVMETLIVRFSEAKFNKTK